MAGREMGVIQVMRKIFIILSPNSAIGILITDCKKIA